MFDFFPKKKVRFGNTGHDVIRYKRVIEIVRDRKNGIKLIVWTNRFVILFIKS